MQKVIKTMSTNYTTTMNSSSSTHTLLPTSSSTMEHTYVNHANYYNEAKEVITGGGVQEQFMVKLFKLLELADLQETNLANIMSWHSHGRFFRVHNSKKAVVFILHRFFNQNKYSSFRRQLNLWGFKRLTQIGADSGAYYHKVFLNSKPFLCRTLLDAKLVSLVPMVNKTSIRSALHLALLRSLNYF